MVDKQLARLIGWREMVMWYVREINGPKQREIVIMDAVMNYDGAIPENGSFRHHAHAFANLAYCLIEEERQISPKKGEEAVAEWLLAWSREHWHLPKSYENTGLMR